MSCPKSGSGLFHRYEESQILSCIIQPTVIIIFQSDREEGRGKIFPGPLNVVGLRHRSKILKKGVSDGFFLTTNMYKIYLRTGSGAMLMAMLGELTVLKMLVGW